MSPNLLALAPNHFYHGADSQYLSWATKTGQGMRWVGLCVPAVGGGEMGQYNGNTVWGVEVDVPAASGWMTGTDMGREIYRWRGSPAHSSHL